MLAYSQLNELRSKSMPNVKLNYTEYIRLMESDIYREPYQFGQYINSKKLVICLLILFLISLSLILRLFLNILHIFSESFTLSSNNNNNVINHFRSPNLISIIGICDAEEFSDNEISYDNGCRSNSICDY